MAGRLQHLVLVLPGVLGSVLAESGGGRGWGPGLGDLACTMRWPSSLSLNDHPGLVPVGLLPTIGLVPPFVVPGYDRLVRRIGAAFGGVQVDLAGPGRARNLHADVVLFPYDFRLGVPAVAEQVEAEIGIRLAGLTAAARHRRVIVVAHSMGGLVARYWLGPLGGWPDCRALITIAAPHRGVPKALDWMVNGVRVRNMVLHSVSEVLREWPSSYDLLPSYPAVLSPGTASPGTASPAEGSPAGPAASARTLRPDQLDAIVARGLGSRVRRALGTSAEIAGAWRTLAGRGDAPEVTSILSRHHPTPNRAVLDGPRLRVTRDDPEWLPYRGWRGDGTVPAISAIPAELDGDERVLRDVPDRHCAMASTPVIIDILREYAEGAPRAPRSLGGPGGPGGPASSAGGPPCGPVEGRAGRPWLALEVDEVALAGQPATVQASLLGDEAGRGTELWLTVRRLAAGAPVFSHRSGAAGPRWQVTIPPLGPGLYAVTARAAGGHGPGRLTCTGMIGMVEA